MLTMISTAFHKGGWGMWPILFVSVVVIAIVVERAVYSRGFAAGAAARATALPTPP